MLFFGGILLAGDGGGIDLIQTVLPEVIAGLGDEDTGETNHADEVGDGHEGIGAVCKVPHDAALGDNTAHKDRHHPEHAVGGNEAGAPQILQGALAKVRPAQQGGDDEGGQADGEQDGTHGTHGLEGMVGEQISICRGNAGSGVQYGGEGHAGEGADDDGIPERTGGGDKCLLHGIGRAHRGGYDGGGTHACLIGEETAAHAILHGKHERGADEAARGCLFAKGAGEDEADGRPHIFGIDHQQQDATYHINNGHGRHAGCAYAGDTLEPTQQHHGDQHEQHTARQPRGHRKSGGLQHASHGIGLRDIADAKGRHGGEHRKEHRQPLAAHTTLQDIHGTAHQLTIGGVHAVANGQQALRIAGGHTQHTGDHAPEDSPRPPCGQSHGHAYNVARAYVGRQRYHEGRKVGNLAILRFPFAEVVPHGAEEVALRETQNQGEVQVSAKQAKKQDVPPQKAARVAEK